jgi:hypothetical protein
MSAIQKHAEEKAAKSDRAGSNDEVAAALDDVAAPADAD